MRRKARAVLAAVAIGVTVPPAAQLTGLRWNGSESAAAGLWRLTNQRIEPGRYVSFCPPPTPLIHEFLERRYIEPGPCPSGSQRMLKRVAAVAGDAWSVSAAGVSVNGTLIPGTEPKVVDRVGRHLVSQFIAEQQVKPGKIVVAGNHSPYALDSRYFGLVEIAAVEGVAVPLLVGR